MALILDLDEVQTGGEGQAAIWRPLASWQRAEPQEAAAEPAWIERERRERAVMMYSVVARMV